MIRTTIALILAWIVVTGCSTQKADDGPQACMNGTLTGAVGEQRSGRGQMTLTAFCEQEGLDLNEAMDLLCAHGYNPGADMTMRDIAFDAGGRAPDVVKLLVPEEDETH